MTGPDATPEAVGAGDLWFIGPKIERVQVYDPESEQIEPAFEAFLGEGQATQATDRGDDAEPSGEAKKRTKSLPPVNKFSTVLPPLPDLPPDEALEAMLDHDEGRADVDRRFVYALLGAVVAVVTLVVVAMTLHPWAHVVVPHH